MNLAGLWSLLWESRECLNVVKRNIRLIEYLPWNISMKINRCSSNDRQTYLLCTQAHPSIPRMKKITISLIISHLLMWVLFRPSKKSTTVYYFQIVLFSAIDPLQLGAHLTTTGSDVTLLCNQQICLSVSRGTTINLHTYITW